MNDEKIEFELQLLAYMHQMVLLQINSSHKHYAPLCDHEYHFHKEGGLRLDWYSAGGEASARKSQSRLLKELQDDDRVHLSGKTRARVARLTAQREQVLLEPLAYPNLCETLEGMEALRKTRCKGVDGLGYWHLIADHKDSANDKATAGNQVFWTWNRFGLSTLRGWTELQTNAAGFLFVALTDSGRAVLKNPPALPAAVDHDSKADDFFNTAMIEARRYWESVKIIDPMNIGKLALPVGVDYPRTTVCRMLPNRSLDGLPE